MTYRRLLLGGHGVLVVFSSVAFWITSRSRRDLFPRLTLREADMRSEERRGRDGREGCGAEWLSHNV